MTANRNIATQDVLAWVNERRAELGGQPLNALPAGTPGARCPVAVALGHDAWVTSTDVVLNGLPLPRRFPLPTYVREFVEDFDLGGYPDLEDGSCRHPPLTPAERADVARSKRMVAARA